MRVKTGVRDPDFPDVELSGRTANVFNVDSSFDPTIYELLWSEETRRELDAAQQSRCDQEGLNSDRIWLSETDLEPDPTRPAMNPAHMFQRVVANRPPEVVEMENRIRAALAVPIGADIPRVTGATVAAYRAYLSARLTLPLPCLHHPAEKGGDMKPVVLVGFTGVDDPHVGIVAEIQRGDSADFVPLSSLGLEKTHEAHQLLEDHAFWFFSRHPLHYGPEESSLFPPSNSQPIWSTLRAFAAYGAAFGAPTGALLATDEYAHYGMWVGMVALSLAGFAVGSRYGRVFGAVNRMRFGPLYGGIFGMLAGVLVGTAAGVMLVGALGTISGAIVGSIVGTIMAAWNWEPIGRNSWAPLGACVGGVVLAMRTESDRAFMGALVGAGSGALLMLLVVTMLLTTVGLASRRS